MRVDMILPVAERISGGSSTSIMSVPHVASVFYKGAYKCGASVLTTTSALTAAHCDYRKTGDSAGTLKVRAGMQSTTSMVNVQERATTTIRKHPSYSAASMKNDIMILKWQRSTKTHSTCNSSTGWNGLVYSPQQFCIEGNPSSSGACFHDGGAPAVHNNIIYGIYSFPDLQYNGSTYPRSAKCNATGKPGVFTQEYGSKSENLFCK
ncbi:Oidioi.mRNA.OKI2018_I69.PAR.g12948.t1.cds [Oikopleura dioica]|uniref:Oidioi.mRNA.OKI2018_I69.PAR.g12948.t1.cds n=1 Tax=Oikopleura dioica TaxID=34765 RepID=A0ABN7S2G5_OIKDI|nr:Oidioi.mRNA.OKI2018_I69.PAR.g12948.t1.cds [Oikopleura dioica]